MKEYIKSNLQDMISDLCKLINIPSVMGEASEGMPFGKDVNAALDYILSWAESKEMYVKNYEGYAGEVSIGNGNTVVGILVHTDVVPAGDGWNTSPFEATIIGDKIYGRGSLDDKSPIVSCLYVMDYINKNNLLSDKYTIRMIIGTNEEDAWGGINYYINKVNKLPDMSIVPDANFPMIFCEKGLLDFNMEFENIKDKTKHRLTEINFGNARNVVPGKATCTVTSSHIEEIKNALSKHESNKSVILVYSDDSVSIVVNGLSTHSMSPEKGTNAIGLMMNLLSDLGKDLDMHYLVEVYNNTMGMTYNGEKINLALEDEVSGKLTMNIGKINILDDKVIFESNIRYPASIESTVIINGVSKCCKDLNLDYIQVDHLGSILVDLDTEIVSKSMSAYEKVTGDTESKPYAIGGATYARAIPNAVAFGPLFPYEDELAHEPNEFVSIDSFAKMTEIYFEALIELTNN